MCVCVLLLAQWGEKGKLGGGGGATAESETYPQPFRFGRRIKAHFSFYKQQVKVGHSLKYEIMTSAVLPSSLLVRTKQQQKQSCGF